VVGRVGKSRSLTLFAFFACVAWVWDGGYLLFSVLLHVLMLKVRIIGLAGL